MLLESNRFEFGEFLLDTEEEVLLRNGKPVSITPKVYEMLFVFLKHHGHLIEKADLIKMVWTDSFVEESSLTFTIGQLRKALGDDARNPRFIETVPRRGYRFIAEVISKKPASDVTGQNELNTEKAESTDGFEKENNDLFSRSNIFTLTKLLAWSGLITVLVVGSYLFFNSFENPQSTSAKRLNIKRIISAKKIGFAAISPNGKLLAYTDESDQKYSLWLRNLETSENVQILPPSDIYFFGLAFTNDGDSLYFVSREQTGTDVADLYRISVFGGIPEKILEHTEGWISLSPDDGQISFVRCEYKDNDFCSLYVANSDGKNERKLLTKPKPIRIADNQFSPDGTSIAFATGQSWNGGSDFRLMNFNFNTNSESEISPQRFFVIKNLRWMPDGKNLLMTAKDEFTTITKIRRVSIETGEIESITNDAEDYFRISLDKSGTKLVATELIDNFRLFYSSIENPAARRNLADARSAAFTHEGNIIYTSKAGNIWTIKPDGTDQRQLTKSSAADYSPLVSRDGRYIFFTSNRSGANQVWRMDTDGGNQIQITRQNGGFPRFISPDGNWVYYESDLFQTLWKVSADGENSEIKCSENKIVSPAFSFDGKLVAYLFRQKKENQAQIAVINFENKTPVKAIAFPDTKTEPIKAVWLNDNQTIIYITQNESGKKLWRQSLDQDTPDLIADLGDEEIRDFDISTDEKSFIIVRGNWLHDIVLISGFQQ